MSPGDLVRIRHFDAFYLGIYIGLAPLNARSRFRFLINGKLADFDLENKLVYDYEVISEAG
jgi:hypothetical protein